MDFFFIGFFFTKREHLKEQEKNSLKKHVFDEYVKNNQLLNEKKEN